MGCHHKLFQLFFSRVTSTVLPVSQMPEIGHISLQLQIAKVVSVRAKFGL